MKKKITITVPKLSSAGGVSSFWNALLPEMTTWEDTQIETLEIGGHGKNVLGPFQDQWNFRQTTNAELDLVVLNPSLGSRSFFRDGLFAKRLVNKNIKFAVFFHGWDLDFEEKVSQKYTNFFRSSFGKAASIFVLSNDFKLKLREWGFEGDVIVETTTVDQKLLASFSEEQKIITSEVPSKIKILFLSRLLREKGIYETIEAFKKLRTKFSNIELIIAGDGKDYDKVVAYVKSDKDIRVTGHVDGDDKIELFKSAHIYCLPSYSEGLPTSVLEAMAFGLPIITTAVGGLKDFFQEEKMGYFVDLKNEEELEHKLALLLSKKELITKIGKYNHTYAMENLIAPVVAKRLYDHFQNSIENTNTISS